jgi:hypothetical protein
MQVRWRAGSLLLNLMDFCALCKVDLAREHQDPAERAAHRRVLQPLSGGDEGSWSGGSRYLDGTTAKTDGPAGFVIPVVANYTPIGMPTRSGCVHSREGRSC